MVSECFDMVVIAYALHIMPDPDSVMIEINRVLKMGGILSAPTYVWEGVDSSGIECEKIYIQRLNSQFYDKLYIFTYNEIKLKRNNYWRTL